MTIERYSTSITELAQKIHKRQPFRLQLPGDTQIFVPMYDVTGYMEGDIVAFEAAQISQNYFYIGVVKHVGKTKEGYRCYDVDCILRPKDHDPMHHVNWLPKARIQKAAILCEIIPEKERNNENCY